MVLGALYGPLVAKSLQILKAEVLRIDFKKNWLRIDFRNEENAIESQKHVHHDNFENFTKSLKITHFAPFGI